MNETLLLIAVLRELQIRYSCADDDLRISIESVIETYPASSGDQPGTSLAVFKDDLLQKGFRFALHRYDDTWYTFGSIHLET